MRSRRGLAGRWSEDARWDVRSRGEILAAWVAVLVFGLAAQVLPFTPGAVPVHGPPVPVVRTAAAVVPVSAVVQTEVAGGSRTVALTFDDGPDPRWTPQVLDLLARHKAVATFCLVGDNVDRYPELVRRIVDAGMRLCHHTQVHDTHLADGSPDEIADDLGPTQRRLEELAGGPVAWFRAPGGYWTDPLTAVVAGAGMQPLGWSVDSGDWRRPGVAAVVSTVQRQIHPGAVVLLHDGGGSREQTVAALEQLLPWLVDRCYAFGFPGP